MQSLNSQNDILMHKLMQFYRKDNNLHKMLEIINGSSKISLRIVDWFSTNYSKKHFTMIKTQNNSRFKVYEDYKLKLKAYSKKRFDPFCRWERIQIPVNEDEDLCFETTIGQLNFFKWAIENEIIQYISENYQTIEKDMNENNSLSKTKKHKSKDEIISLDQTSKTRKKREELSVSAIRTFKKEKVEITVNFD